MVNHRQVCLQPSIPCPHNCGNGAFYKFPAELIDHLEQECDKASVICHICALEIKREDKNVHKCTQELIKNANPNDISTIKAVLQDLDKKITDENVQQDGVN